MDEKTPALSLARARDSSRGLTAFDPDLHSDILFRGLLMRISLKDIAELVGVPVTVLQQWIEREPAMREAVADASQADSKVQASLYYSAIGWDQYNKIANKKGPDVRAALAWLKQRQGWKEDKKPPLRPEEMTTSQIVALLREMEHQLIGRASTPGDGLVIDVETDPDVDAGF